MTPALTEGPNMKTGYVIPDTGRHDLSPTGRLLVKYGPVTKPGSAVDTRYARTGQRTIRHLLTTTEGLRFFGKLVKSKRGRRRLADLYYRQAYNVARYQQYKPEDVAQKLAVAARAAAHVLIKRCAVHLAQNAAYARALRLSPVVDHERPQDSLFITTGADLSAYRSEHVPTCSDPVRDYVFAGVSFERVGNRIVCDYSARENTETVKVKPSRLRCFKFPPVAAREYPPID